MCTNLTTVTIPPASPKSGCCGGVNP
jgi:hypothetical protein